MIVTSFLPNKNNIVNIYIYIYIIYIYILYVLFADNRYIVLFVLRSAFHSRLTHDYSGGKGVSATAPSELLTLHKYFPV